MFSTTSGMYQHASNENYLQTTTEAQERNHTAQMPCHAMVLCYNYSTAFRGLHDSKTALLAN